MNPNIRIIAGTPISIHWKNVMSTPEIRSSMPMPIRFGGVPTGVAIPPTEAPNAVISIIAIAKLRTFTPVRARCATIESPIGNIIAIDAVHEHRLRQDEAAHEEKDDGIREWGKRGAGGRDLEHNGQRRTEQRRHRNG